VRPDFDEQLHDLLHDAAREIPSDVTITPALLRRIAAEEHHARSFSMRSFQRFIAPTITLVLIVALAITFVTIHGAHGVTNIAVQPSATATATPAPSASFSPSSITRNGITIQIDHVDANAFRIVVSYHFVTPLANPGDEYDGADIMLVDEHHFVHFPLANDIAYPHGIPGTPYLTQYFAPLAADPVTSHTLHFLVPEVMLVGVEGSGRKQFINGPWDFTLTLVPAVSGMQITHVPPQVHGTISVAPESISWVNGGDAVSRGVVIQLAISGLPKVADPVNHPLYFDIPHTYNGEQSSSEIGDPTDTSVTLTLADGTNPRAAYFVSADTVLVPQNSTAFGTTTGSINMDGSATVAVGFQGVTLAVGQTVHLTIKQLIISDSNTFQHFAGPWSMSFTL
jgi:hypothetical protein